MPTALAACLGCGAVCLGQSLPLYVFVSGAGPLAAGGGGRSWWSCEWVSPWHVMDTETRGKDRGRSYS